MLNSTSIGIDKIIKQCEQSQLISFAYQDAKISIQFSKHGKEETSFMSNERKLQDSCLDMNNIHIAMEETAVSEVLEVSNFINENIVTVASPFVGTVELSNQIKLFDGVIPINKGDVICSIEAMKIYNDIKSPVTGTIIQILIEDCSLVEFEQPIVRVRVEKDE